EAMKRGVRDDGAHPYVGELLFYDPTAVDPRFDDPGGWFTCSGTLVSPTIVVTAGHCTFGTGLNGEPTASGSGGNDVWISFAEEPDYSTTWASSCSAGGSSCPSTGGCRPLACSTSCTRRASSGATRRWATA